MNKKFSKLVTLITYLTLSLLCGIYQPVWADLEDGVYSGESQPGADGLKAFTASLSADLVSKTKIKNKDFHSQDFTYRTSEVDATIGLYSNPRYREGLGLSLSFDSADIAWEGNPFFDQQKFYQASAALTFTTQRICDWDWLLMFQMTTDAQRWDVEEYGYYTFFLWGRNTYNETVGVHLGMMGVAGWNVTQIYPIIGFDWKFSDRWKLNAIFPINIALDYQLTDHWVVSLAGRFFLERYRSDKEQPLPYAILTYKNVGGELAANYKFSDWIKFNLHVGYTLGGQVRVMDQHGDDRRHFDLNPSGYLGGEFSLMF